jgi:hypothetical protein
MKFIFGGMIIISLIGCASYFKRKDCEQVNWYDYGQKVAMSGRRLEADQFLNECRKVEAEVGESKLDLGYKSGRDRYCTMDEIYNTGKSGHPFSYELCDHLSRQKVKEKHLEGVLVFCKPENAYPFGAKGGVYEKVCPEDKETAFLKEYNKGRKVFLEAAIKSNEVEIADLEKDSNRLQRDKEFKMMNLSRLPAAPMVSQTVQQGDTKTVVLDPFQQERDRLRNQINSISSEMRSIESKREKLKEDNRQMRQEALAL